MVADPAVVSRPRKAAEGTARSLCCPALRTQWRALWELLEVGKILVGSLFPTLIVAHDCIFFFVNLLILVLLSFF